MSRFIILGLTAMLLVACAAFNPRSLQLSGRDREQVLTAFTAFASEQKTCPAAIEAGFVADFNSFWRNRRVEGEVWIKSPAAIKFTAVDPLGRPVLILAVDGGDFTAVNIPEATVYSGPPAATKAGELLPRALVPDLFYLLIGRLPPGGIVIRRISPDRESGFTRIRFSPAVDAALVREVVFDRDRNRLISQTIFDRGGGVLLTLNYSRYRKIGCDIPTAIELLTSKGRLALNLQTPVAIKEDIGFELSWPPMFKQIKVK